MKRLSLLSLVLAWVFASNVARAGGRTFGPYAGIELSKVFSTVQQPGVNANLSGWGNSADVGLDVPFTDNFGFSVDFEIGQKEIRNNAQSSTYLDDTKLNTKSARGLFYYQSIYVGGSYQTAGADLVTISTQSGASTAHVDLTGSTYFAGYAMTYKNLLRASVEGESSTFSSTGFNYTDYTVALKLQFLFSGLFDRN